MKIADVDVLIVPGWTNSGPDHWQSRWAAKIKTARRVEQAEWDRPMIGDWAANIVAAVVDANRPVILVAHGCGVPAVVHAAGRLPVDKVAGAFLVATVDLAAADIWPATHGGFFPVPMMPLPFRSVLLAPSNDPYCSPQSARASAAAWRAALIEAGDVGHINAASGHGPWPEGLMRLGWFLKQLDAS